MSNVSGFICGRPVSVLYWGSGAVASGGTFVGQLLEYRGEIECESMFSPTIQEEPEETNAIPRT